MKRSRIHLTALLIACLIAVVYPTILFASQTAQNNPDSDIFLPTILSHNSTPQNKPPYTPNTPSPNHQSVGHSISVVPMTWQGGDPDGDDVTFSVYFGANTNTPTKRICLGWTKACVAEGLEYDTTYAWQVVAEDEHGAKTEGPVWTFITKEEPKQVKVDLVLLIDSSGSMTSNDPRNLRKEAAKAFVDAMGEGDQIAIVDFDHETKTPWPLQPVSAERSGPKQAIDTIDSSGNTNIGRGLRTAYDELDSSQTNYPKAAVLLTDGNGDYNDEAVLYAAKGWRVYTIGLQNGTDERLLRQIADDTGGQFYALTDANQLVDVYADILNAVTGSSSISNQTVRLEDGQTETLDVSVPANQTIVNFLVNWEGSTVDTTLREPGGRLITPQLAASDPEIYHAKGETYELYQLADPVDGDWEVVLYGADLPPGGEDVLLQVSGRGESGVWSAVGNGSKSGGGISNNSGKSDWPSIAVGPDSTVYVTWTDDSNGKEEIYVRQWKGGSWQQMGNQSASGGGISQNNGISRWSTIAVGSNGTPVVAWEDNSSGNYEIYVKYWTGNQWQPLGSGAASGGGVSNNNGSSQKPSLAVASDGSVYLAWQNESGGDTEIFVKRWTGNSWQDVGNGSSSGGGISNNSGDSFIPDVVLDSAERPIVAWHDHTIGESEIYLKRWSGSSWVNVGTGSSSGGGISNNAGPSRRPFLAITTNDDLYVVWTDGTDSDFEIYARQFTNNAWSDIGTGSASGGGISRNAGDSRQASAGIGTDGRLYAIWYDDSGGADYEIFARRWQNGIWSELGIGSSTGGGISDNTGTSGISSIAVAPDGVPYVAWGDDSSGDYEIYVSRYLE